MAIVWRFGALRLVREGLRYCGMLMSWFELARDNVSAYHVAHCQAPFSTISFYVFAKLLQAFCWGNIVSSFMYGVVDIS